jgi:hypothetical protein
MCDPTTIALMRNGSPPLSGEDFFVRKIQKTIFHKTVDKGYKPVYNKHHQVQKCNQQ